MFAIYVDKRWGFVTTVLFFLEVFPFLNVISKAKVIVPPILEKKEEALSFSVSTFYTSVCQFYFDSMVFFI